MLLQERDGAHVLFDQVLRVPPRHEGQKEDDIDLIRELHGRAGEQRDGNAGRMLSQGARDLVGLRRPIERRADQQSSRAGCFRPAADFRRFGARGAHRIHEHKQTLTIKLHAGIPPRPGLRTRTWQTHRRPASRAPIHARRWAATQRRRATLDPAPPDARGAEAAFRAPRGGAVPAGLPAVSGAGRPTRPAPAPESFLIRPIIREQLHEGGLRRNLRRIRNATRRKVWSPTAAPASVVGDHVYGFWSLEFGDQSIRYTHIRGGRCDYHGCATGVLNSQTIYH